MPPLRLEQIFIPMPDENERSGLSGRCCLARTYRETYGNILACENDVSLLGIDFDRYFREIAIEGITSQFRSNSLTRSIADFPSAYRSEYLDSLPLECVQREGQSYPPERILPSARFASSKGIGRMERSKRLKERLDEVRQYEIIRLKMAGEYSSDTASYLDKLSRRLFGNLSGEMPASKLRRYKMAAGRVLSTPQARALIWGVSADERRRAIGLFDPIIVIEGIPGGGNFSISPEFLQTMWPGFQAYYSVGSNEEYLNSLRAFAEFLKGSFISS